MKKFSELLKECQTTVQELMPWDLIELLASDNKPLIIDVREPSEFVAMHIKDSLHVPRGLLETSCEYGFEETLPILVEAREKPIIVVCRSGNRSLLAARTMQELGYQKVQSLMTGLRGWNDYDQELVDEKNELVDNDFADEFLTSIVSKEQMPPDVS